jgi:hypothetical protein
MTDRDKDRFRAVMLQVAIDKRYQQQLDVAMLRIMFDTLKPHVEIEEIERVQPELMLKCQFFPRTDEWLKACQDLPPAPVAGLLMPVGVHEQTKKPKYCEKCNDEGWVEVGEPQPGVAARVVACDCRPNNPALGAGQRRKPKERER